ncbi:hypothetical protein Cpap_1465 [Ruminiclostridium papyrosolvens DSM 2782]|uniref:Uncharacterized protein n=1 Tax=Ruminiclostridium papyrosolvens DSM 2782 TaxID=588581 RepID=F1TEA7_9FIRM|nr:hypothetical protein [Ruminiclostridium papyrosolvens]EGD47073.1 hypothetical protein Cpap_1465 [Ruminiclostridium papyrosolvens DSM 2782]WES36015.1 hypothetical protein P0092_08655 [Ruminiclostridium papyrosolvens DSM 2782]WES36113.1 hypothetical protein P0092_09155 [Ruminiclostridium papyrosolvens DSM 2782]
MGGGRNYDSKIFQTSCPECYSTAELVQLLKIDVSCITMNQLKQLWNCTDIYIYNCMVEGMPHTGTGNKSTFNLDKCQRWHRGEEVI